MRHNIHKVILKGLVATLPITVATSNFERLPLLINNNRTLYATMMKEPSDQLTFEVTDTLYTMNMSEEQYAEELMMVDILDEDQTQFVI